MVEPINPQDHSIGVGECKYELDERFSFDEWHMAALAEAIHQTFERDEHRYVNRTCRNCGNEYKAGSISCEQMDEGDYSAVCCMNPHACDGNGCDLGWDECDHFFYVDPNTEIDRIARLIVDGEYRRRREAEREGA